MGSATTTNSAASEGGYTEAKRRAQEAFADDDVQTAVDLAVTAGLAAQPNGPAKVPMWAYAKHTATFASESSENGVEAGLKKTGERVIKSEVTGAAAGGVVESVQQSITTAAENDTVAEGTAAANKNLDSIAEQAATDAVGEMIGKGADALFFDEDGDRND